MKKNRLLIAMGTLCLIPIHVSAQDETNGSGRKMLEETIITAERRESNIQVTPIAVTALTNAGLEMRLINDVVDLATSVPNLYLLEATANPSTLSVAMRGAAEQTGGLAVAESSVGVYVDDVYRSRPSGTNLKLTDIERIEVLRGPQGTLYGRNTIAGAIKIVTRKPSETTYANVSVGVGEFDKVVTKAALGGQIADNVGASIALLYSDEDGFKDNIALGKKVGGQNNFAGRVVLNLLNTDRLEGTLTLFGASDDNDGYVAIPGTFPNENSSTDDVTYSAGGIYKTQSPVQGNGETDQWSVTLNTSYHFDDFNLLSITGYVDIDDLFLTDFSGGQRTGPDSFTNGFTRLAVGEYQQFSQELQLSGDSLDEKLDWMVGAYYFQERNKQEFNDSVSTFLTFLPMTFDLETVSYALFANANYALSDRLTLVTGIRWSVDEKENDAMTQGGFVPPVSLVAVKLDEQFSSVSPRVGLNFQMNDDTFLYASASRGFKSGGFNALAVANPAVLSTPYDEMTVWSYEAGLKQEFLENRVRLNAAVFFADYDDIQQTAQIPGLFSFAIQNVGSAEVYGLELELEAIVTDGLTVYGQLGLQHDEYVSINENSTAAIFGADRLAVTPRVTGQLGFSYQNAVSDSGTLLLGLNASYSGSYYSSVDNTLKTESYNRVNGYIGFEFLEHWGARFSVRNLTETEEAVCCTTASTGLQVLAPRTWLFEVKYDFEA